MSDNKPSTYVNSSTLTHISDEYLELLDELEAIALANDGIIPDDMNDAFTALSGTMKQKIERSGGAIRSLGLHMDIVKGEEKRLNEFRKSLEGDQDRLKKYVTVNMVRTGIKRSDGNFLKVGTRLNPPGCIIECSELVPEEFKVYSFKLTSAEMTTIMKAQAAALASGAIEKTVDLEVQPDINKRAIIQKWKDAEPEEIEVPSVDRHGHPILHGPDKTHIELHKPQVPGSIVSQSIGLRVW